VSTYIEVKKEGKIIIVKSSKDGKIWKEQLRSELTTEDFKLVVTVEK